MGLHAYIPVENGSIFDLPESAREARTFWGSSYSSFSSFRNEVAKAAGWPLEDTTHMIMGKPHVFTGPATNGVAMNDERWEGYWATLPANPLALFFLHSDCQGRILHHHAGALADALEPLVAKMPAEPCFGVPGNPPWADELRNMITCLRTCAKVERDIEFH